MAKHTPAPWALLPMDNRGWISVRSPDHRTVAEVVCQLPEETAGNAQLIAAAPALLGALQDLLTAEKFDDDDPQLFAARQRAKAAIIAAIG